MKIECKNKNENGMKNMNAKNEDKMNEKWIKYEFTFKNWMKNMKTFWRKERAVEHYKIRTTHTVNPVMGFCGFALWFVQTAFLECETFLSHGAL